MKVLNDGKIKAWIDGLDLCPRAEEQLYNSSSLSIIHGHVAVMPDVHWGMGATIGSVIPTLKAIIPAAVGVDIGCGMMAVQTSMKAEDLPLDLVSIRTAIENAVPHGRTNDGKRGDRGAWNNIPDRVRTVWRTHLETGFDMLCEKYDNFRTGNNIVHLGTLGTGNHFIEVCLDETDTVWFMLHSGSRGIGNKIGSTFIKLAKKDMGQVLGTLPDKNLAYLTEGTKHFEDYVEGVQWAQNFAKLSREIMMDRLVKTVSQVKGMPKFKARVKAINCHHNYVQQETHFDEKVWLTRKGAVNASEGTLGIIPGSMGERSFIVRGKGNPDSYESCSHGAGRVMSRTAARKAFTVEDHIKATEGVECRKDKEVIDETPGAYKNIDDVMSAQSDLVDIVHTLKQIVCVKG